MKFCVVALALLAATAQAIILDLPVGQMRCVEENVRNNNVFTMDYKLFQATDRDYDPVRNDDPLRAFTMKITDRNNMQLYQSGEAAGRFTFTPSYDGVIHICMSDTVRGIRRPNLRVRAVDLKHIHGTTTSQFSEMARKEKLQVCLPLLLRCFCFFFPIHSQLFSPFPAPLYSRLRLSCAAWRRRSTPSRTRSSTRSAASTTSATPTVCFSSFFILLLFFFFGSVIHTRRICVTELMNARCAWLPIIAVVAMSISTGAQIYYLRTFFQKKKLI